MCSYPADPCLVRLRLDGESKAGYSYTEESASDPCELRLSKPTAAQLGGPPKHLVVAVLTEETERRFRAWLEEDRSR